MKTIINFWLVAVLFCVLLAYLTGCASPGSVVRAMGKDPATVHVRVTTIYGSVEVSRTNPMTNSIPHSIGADGTVTVGK